MFKKTTVEAAEHQDVLDVVYSGQVLQTILAATVEEGYSRKHQFIMPHAIFRDIKCGKLRNDDIEIFAHISYLLNADEPLTVSCLKKALHLSEKRVRKGVQRLIDQGYLQ